MGEVANRQVGCLDGATGVSQHAPFAQDGQQELVLTRRCQVGLTVAEKRDHDLVDAVPGGPQVTDQTVPPARGGVALPPPPAPQRGTETVTADHRGRTQGAVRGRQHPPCGLAAHAGDRVQGPRASQIGEMGVEVQPSHAVRGARQPAPDPPPAGHAEARRVDEREAQPAQIHAGGEEDGGPGGEHPLPAGLVTWEARLVEQLDVEARPAQQQGQGAPDRSRAHDDHLRIHRSGRYQSPS
jgi:hypothetical protein